MSTHRGRRLALALTLGVGLTLGAATPSDAARSPSFLLDGGDRWFTHDVGWYVVAQGPVEIDLGGRTLKGTMSATVQPDDHTMPGPDECEDGMVFVFVEGKGAADTMLSSVGTICGHHVQLPDSVVTTTYTGIATIEESGLRKLEGEAAFLEIRLAQDGGAHVFATTS